MKKEFAFILLLVFILNFISAVEFDIKSYYNQGETLITKISGNFIDTISKGNIFFYEDYVRVPIQYDIAKIEDEYYFYAILPEKQENYSVSIEDVKYYQGSRIIEDDIKRNFSTTSELADFSLNPGFVITSEVFSLNIQNLQDSKNTININYDGKETEIELKSGEKKTINFRVENVNQDSLKYIQLSSGKTNYNVPVYVFTNEPQNALGEKGLKFEITKPEISMSTNFEKKKIIYLKNTGEEDLENISLSLTDELKPYVNLSLEYIGKLKENSSGQIELTIKSREDEKYIIGEIKAKIGGETYAFGTIYLNFIKDYIPASGDNETSDGGNIILTKTCDELGGKVCAEGETCEGETADSFEGDCCLSKTCKVAAASSTGKIVGWSLVIIILLFVVWFFMKKYRGAKGPLTILEKAKGRN
ncbi:MAG: hypothetical protein WC584_04640 [Candidatus Pacearchaeota archaeon]